MSAAVAEVKRSRRARRKEAVILFTISGSLFAVAASAVHEIRSADSLGGSALDLHAESVPKVKHIVQRGRRTYFVVNGCAHFGLKAARPELVLVLREFPAAVLVDKIERMAEIWGFQSLPLAFDGPERQWYRGLTYFEDRVIPVINPGGFLTAEELRALEDVARATFSAAADVQGTAS